MIWITPQEMNKHDIRAIERAVNADNRTTMAIAMKDIYDGFSRLIRIGSSVLTLQPSGKGLHIAQMSGVLEDMDEIHKELCALRPTHIDIDGRPGWRKVLTRYGFKPHGKLLRLTL